MNAFQCELCKRGLDEEDNQHFGTTWWTPEDVIREAKENFGAEVSREEAITLLKQKFDYLRDIMIEAATPEIQSIIGRHLKGQRSNCLHNQEENCFEVER